MHTAAKVRRFLRAVSLLALLGLAELCTAAPPLSPQLVLVTKLYKDFAFEAAIDETNAGRSFLESSRAVFLTYLTPKLTDLLLRDRECMAKSHGICNLDFDPIWDSQDPVGAVVRIMPTESVDKIRVQLRYASTTLTLTYHLSLTRSGWRIQDIIFEKEHVSLAQMLSKD
jgi:hypothetical protein